MDDQQLREIQHLASLYVDGDLDEAGLRHLAELLTGDEAATKSFVDLLSMHSDLILLGSGGSEAETPVASKVDKLAVVPGQLEPLGAPARFDRDHADPLVVVTSWHALPSVPES